MKHSYTSLSLFLKCPSRYKAQYIDKRVPRTSSPALERGVAIHGELEKALINKTPVPPYWVDQRLWDNLLKLPVEVEGKVETPRLTGKIDFFVQSQAFVLVGDFKTGRSTADPLQADFYATLLRESRGADEVEAVFVYVDQKKISPIMRPAKDAGDTIHQLVDRVEHETKWFTKPGFYCTGCPLQDCRYWKASRW